MIIKICPINRQRLPRVFLNNPLFYTDFSASLSIIAYVNISQFELLYWQFSVIPAKAGIHEVDPPYWIPAFAGMTLRDLPNANRSFWVYVSIIKTRQGHLYNDLPFSTALPTAGWVMLKSLAIAVMNSIISLAIQITTENF